MKTCPHRGFRYDGPHCPYHGYGSKGCPKFNRFAGEAVFGRSMLAPLYVKADPPVSDYDPRWAAQMRARWGELIYVSEMAVEAPWHLWMQNTADFHHVKHVHPDFYLQIEGEPFDIQISHDKRCSSHSLRIAEDTVAGIERFVGGPTNGIFRHVIENLRTSLTSFLGVFYSRETALPAWKRPVCLVRTEFFLSLSRPVPRALAESFIEASKKILLEDKAIVEAWAPSARETGNWMRGEARVRAFCEALREEQGCKATGI